jgi:DNA helicase-2/ATP-dependent DNA helicase PcrA
VSEDLMQKLNSRQKEAVTHESGPLLIVAGAGTGKTTVLINRLAHLVLDCGLSTEEILLLTFTEKSAGELEARADTLLPYGYVDLWIHTFHGFCERILREHALDIGLAADFKLLSATEQWILIKRNLSRFNLDYYKPLGNPTKFISELLRHFSRLKDEDVSAIDYLETAAKSLEEDDLEVKRLEELAGAYQTYNELLLENNFLDFGDLIVFTLKLFKTRPNILSAYQKQFKHIMVDEFQDTNWAQYELVKMLALPNNNLTVVGDDDQSIYKFRGASISNIMQFKDDYKEAKELVLIDNYRSRQEILDYSYEFIKHNNPNRLEEKLQIDKQLKSGADFTTKETAAVKYLQFNRGEEEVSFVASQIADLYEQQKVDWLDFAILVRANDTADAYVKELTRLGIPNQFVSLKGLYFKEIILDCLAYLRLLDNYHESSALFRVLNMPSFKVSHLDIITINKFAKHKVWSLFEALKNIAVIPGISSAAQESIFKLLELLDKHSKLVADCEPSKIFLRFAYDSGLVSSYDFDRDQEIFSYLNQFYQKIKKFEETLPASRLSDFMQLMDLELEAGEVGALRLDFSDNDTVKIMTVHAAKGLEFRYVFLVNIVDKKFPTISRSEKISIPDNLVKEKIVSSKDAHIEEERRLFYVAITRAKEELFITGAKDYGGVREKKPSPFIAEMGLNIFEVGADENFSNKLELIRDLERIDRKEPEKPEKLVLPDKFSFSQLAAFSTCPLQYKFAFVLKIPAPTDKASLIFGRVLHNVLHDFLEPLEVSSAVQDSLFSKPKAELNEKKLLVLYEDRWQADGYDSKEEREKYYQKGKNILKTFWANLSAEDFPEILFLEKNFTFKIGDGIIKGAIDRVDRLPDGTLEIIDYKTGNPKEKLEYADKRQLILYKIFLEEFLKISVSKLSYYYLEGTYKTSFEAKDKDVEKLRLEVLEEIAEIKKGNFPPSPTELCKYCDFRDICQWRYK